jgi:hypothetical protein
MNRGGGCLPVKHIIPPVSRSAHFFFDARALLSCALRNNGVIYAYQMSGVGPQKKNEPEGKNEKI